MSRSQPKIAIIVLNWNGKQDTLACLESLTQLNYVNFEVIVVNNGSTDGTTDAIRTHFPNFILIQNAENLGFAEGNNVGMRTALQRGAELLFLLNNDTIVAADILDRFVDMYDSFPEAGILGARIYLLDQKQMLDHLGGMWNNKTAEFELIGKHHKEDEVGWQNPQELDYVCGAGLMIKKKVIDAIGYLDPRFSFGKSLITVFVLGVPGLKFSLVLKLKSGTKFLLHLLAGNPIPPIFGGATAYYRSRKIARLSEKIHLYLRILIPDILHMLKIHFIKSIQLKWIEFFKPQKDIREKKEKLIKNRAALCAVRDYLMRRFGKGPDWIQTLAGKNFDIFYSWVFKTWPIASFASSGPL